MLIVDPDETLRMVIAPSIEFITLRLLAGSKTRNHFSELRATGDLSVSELEILRRGDVCRVTWRQPRPSITKPTEIAFIGIQQQSVLSGTSRRATTRISQA